MAALYIRCGVKHFLHARTAFRSFVRDHNHITRNHFSAKDTFTSRILRIEYFCGTGKLPDTPIHTSRFDHATIQCDIPFQDSQAAVLGISMLDIADTSGDTVGIQFLIVGFLRSHPDTETTGRGTFIFPNRLVRYIRGSDCILINSFSKRHTIHTLHIPVYQTAFQQFVHNPHDPSGAVYILNMIDMRVGSNLAKARSLAGKHINIVHREIGLRFLCNREQMKNRIRRTSHCYIQ